MPVFKISPNKNTKTVCRSCCWGGGDVRYHKLQKCFKLISFFVPKAVKTLSDKTYSLLSVTVCEFFSLFLFKVHSTRANHASSEGEPASRDKRGPRRRKNNVYSRLVPAPYCDVVPVCNRAGCWDES